MNDDWILRPACDFDGADIACLIDRVYREHGDRLAARRGDRDVLQIEESYWRRGGAFVVLELRHNWSNAGEIVGTAGMMPAANAGALRRFYVDPAFREHGAGRVLIRWAVAWAQIRIFKRLEFWSDRRFAKGHRFFEGIGLERLPGEREMADGVVPYHEVLFGGAVEAIAAKLHRDV